MKNLILIILTIAFLSCTKKQSSKIEGIYSTRFVKDTDTIKVKFFINHQAKNLYSIKYDTYSVNNNKSKSYDVEGAYLDSIRTLEFIQFNALVKFIFAEDFNSFISEGVTSKRISK